MEKLVVAGGCFWGLEELFRNQRGVIETEVGYMGGQNDMPTYDNHPGHAEVVEIAFDPSETSTDSLLDYFFRIHDPTTKNRQGNDAGESYRSAIFYANESQKEQAKDAIIRNQVYWRGAIVTSVEPLGNFRPAENEHQDYLQKNPDGYTCHFERSR